jgi:hypothetical protein
MRPSLARTRVRTLAVVACAAGACAAPAPAAPPGCAYRVPTVAHGPGGAALPAARTDPIACADRTGFATSETNIEVTPKGTVMFSPAGTENSLARSPDGGVRYELTAPAVMEYTALWNTVDPVLTVDRTTGRVFWAHATGATRTLPYLVAESPLPNGIPTILAAAYGFQVYASADEGRTWTTSDHREAPVGDWEKVIVGPPRPADSGAPQPKGYPNVVYLCGNSPFEVSGPGRICYRSLDGGLTFDIAGYVTPSPNMPAEVCPPLAANTGVVLPTGVVVHPLSCNGAAYVAVSEDEGASYHFFAVPGAPPSNGLSGSLQIVADRAGVLYATWVDGDAIRYMTSPDAGRTWGAPKTMTAPGLRFPARPAPAAGARGQFGVAYYASTDAKATSLSFYATRTLNALDASPRFASAPLNDPAKPMYVDGGLTGATPRADYFGAAWDDAGTFWAGGVEQLSPPGEDGKQATTGYVGRLLAPDLAAAPAGACLTSGRLVYRFGADQRGKVVRVVVQVDGRRVLARRGRHLTKVTIPRPRKARYTVRITTTNRRGGGVVTTRSYRGCTRTKLVSHPFRSRS